ncbi:MAG TPA: hypothetical protein VLT13_02945 [Bacteroidota bacterium]|nr:hypothetical protein [Bacteroidota bacterium]
MLHLAQMLGKLPDAIGAAECRRRIYKRTRPGSRPYISGDGFRRIANHIFDETRSHFKADRLRPGDIIFVATHLAKTFFREYAPQIRVPYTLITHNSDMAASEQLIGLIDENVQAWFAQNNTYAHERVTPIPIGLENLHHYRAGIPAKFSAIRRPRRERNRVLVSFNVSTNPAEREAIQDLARQLYCADCVPQWLDQDTYLRTLTEYRFVLSPPGHGLDTHRTWEAMYLGVIPIVGDSVAMRSFEELGLPVWILQNWHSLVKVRTEDLEEKYEELNTRFSNRALYFEYWERRIIESSRLMQTTARALSMSA